MSEYIFKNNELIKTAGNVSNVDLALDSSSTNPIANKAVSEAVSQINTNLVNCISYNSSNDYLYIDGLKWKRAYFGDFVIFDDDGFSEGYGLGTTIRWSSPTTNTGNWVLQNNTLTTIAPNTANNVKGGRINGSINFAQYSNVYVEYKVNGTSYSISLDVSSITATAYLAIMIPAYSNGSANMVCTVISSLTQDTAYPDNLKYAAGTCTQNATVIITKILLEK